MCLDSALAGPFVNLRLSWPAAPKQFQTSGGHVADANGVKGTLIKLIEEAPAFPGQMIHRPSICKEAATRILLDHNLIGTSGLPGLKVCVQISAP